ncbi:MAG TPA: WD40 repeat domain-containing protein [Chloroflexia bacterium]|jgi:WD40 repeat protein
MTSVRKRAFTVFILLTGLSLLIMSCGGDSELKDTGPNANLNNDELLKKAVENMKVLQSYHFDFTGGLPSEMVQMSRNLSITADIQLADKGSTIKIRDESGEVSGGTSLMLDIGSGLDVTITKDGWYESYDQGKSWYKAQTDTPGGFLMAMFGWMWDRRATAGSDEYPTPGEKLVGSLNFKDATPRLEQIDGIITRHMVADFNSAAKQPEETILYDQWEGAKRADIWVSTEITPTIRQMRIEGSNTVKRNQTGPAKSVTFSPDGKTLAVAHGDAQDWTVRLWDLTRPGSMPKKLRGDGGVFMSVAFSPDGKLLAAGVHAGGGPTKVHIWDMADLNAAPVTLPVPDSVSSVDFQPGGKMLAAAGSSSVYIWQPPYKSTTPTVISYPTDNVVNSVAFSSDQHTLATGNLNAGVRVHDVGNLGAEPTVLPHEWVNEVAFSPDGHLLASIGGFVSDEGHTVKIWDLRHPVPTAMALPGDNVTGETVAFSPDGKFLAASGQGGEVQLWGLNQLASAGARPTPTFVLEVGSVVYSVAFSPDSKILAAADSGGEVRLWDIDELQKEGKPPGSATPTVVKEDEQSTGTPYTLTWKWGRFNDDFGEVKPPPAETIKPFP